MNCHIRYLLRKDLSEVLNIELDTSHEPLNKREFVKILKDSKLNAVARVAEHDNIIIGFMLYSLCQTYIEVIRFAVDPYYQKTGVGTQMLNMLKGKLSHNKKKELKFHVHQDFLKGHLFLKKNGFVGRINRKNREIYDFNFIKKEQECPV